VTAIFIGAAVGRLSRTEGGLLDGWRRFGRFAQSSPLAASCTTLQGTAIFWPSRHVLLYIPRSARVRDARLAEHARRWRVRQREGRRWVSSCLRLRLTQLFADADAQRRKCVIMCAPAKAVLAPTQGSMLRACACTQKLLLPSACWHCYRFGNLATHGPSLGAPL
jgi:hypothetical protein